MAISENVSLKSGDFVAIYHKKSYGMGCTAFFLSPSGKYLPKKRIQELGKLNSLDSIHNT